MESIPPIIYFLLALGCFLGCVGIVIWMLGYFRKDQPETPQPEEQKSPLPEAAKAAVASPPQPPASAPQEEERELLRILRTPAGQMVFLVRGKRYNSLREIKDALAERDAAESLHAMLGFAEGWLPALHHAPPTSPGPSVTDKPTTEEGFLQQLRQSDLFGPEPGKRESLVSAGGSIIAAVDKSIRAVVSPSRGSMLVAPAEQINALVQQRLQDRPEMRRYGIIRLSTGRDGTLQFHVGLHTYDAPENIPEPDVREIILDAIAEWRGD